METRDFFCRCLCALGWAFKAYNRSEKELDVVLGEMLSSEQAEWVIEQRKPSLALFLLLRPATMNLSLRYEVSISIMTRLTELDLVFGRMERIVSTPLSPTYMRHTSRGLFLLLAKLPVTLVGAGVKSLGTVLTIVLSVTYVMVGIDEIGIQIEQPFDALPLHALAKSRALALYYYTRILLYYDTIPSTPGRSTRLPGLELYILLYYHTTILQYG